MRIYQSKDSSSKTIISWLFFFLLLLTFAFLPNFAKAQVEDNIDENGITEEQLQQLKDEGIIGQEVTLKDIEDVNRITKKEVIEKIKPSDDLAEYNLTINKNGEIVSQQNKNTLSVIAFTYPGSSTFAQPGDILITNSTVASGIFGHAGIVTSDSLKYASIRNKNSNPRSYSLQSWFEDYPNTKVIRINDRTKANAAGRWATDYVRDYSHASYAITLAINSLDPTYCSKIVWQAYANTGNVVGTASSGIKAPAVFLMRHNYPGAVPKVIYSTGADFGSGDF